MQLDEDATLLVGRTVTGFTKAEDVAESLFHEMPFSLQERMESDGARFVAFAPRSPHVETDGQLITGQNPASALVTAEAFLKVLGAGS